MLKVIDLLTIILIILYLIIPNILYLISKSKDDYYETHKTYYILNLVRIILNSITSFFEILNLILLELTLRNNAKEWFMNLIIIFLFFNEFANLNVFSYCCALIHNYRKYEKKKPITLAYFSFGLIFGFLNLIFDLFLFSMTGIFCENLMNEQNQNEYYEKKNKKLISDLLSCSQIEQCNENKENEECSICLEKYKIGENIIILPCKHYYHYDCFINWIKTKFTCPLDNISLEKIIKDYKKENSDDYETNNVVIYSM